ncbi:dehydrogenase/reductase SDR family member 7-like [Ixodes scapularis]
MYWIGFEGPQCSPGSRVVKGVESSSRRRVTAGSRGRLPEQGRPVCRRYTSAVVYIRVFPKIARRKEDMICFLFGHSLAALLLLVLLAVGLFLVWFKYADADLPLVFLSKFGRSPGVLKGSVVWITGASSGIGESLSYELARAGAKLALSGTNTERLRAVKDKCIGATQRRIAPTWRLRRKLSFLSKGGYAEVVRRGPALRLDTRATQVSPEISAADLRAPSPQQEQHAAPLGKGAAAIAVPALPFKTVA